MVTHQEHNIKTVADCECCQLSTDSEEDLFGCSGRQQVFTLEEQQILKAIREVGQRARQLKAQMQQSAAELPGSRSDRQSLEQELAALRRQRADLEKQRVAAAEERMRRLGHA